MLQRILLDLNTTIEQLEMLDKAIFFLTDFLNEEIDDKENSAIKLEDIKVYLWIIAAITSHACCTRDGIESIALLLERKGKEALNDSNSDLLY